MLKLTNAQHRQWAVDGYLHLKQVLDPDEVALYSRLIDEMRYQPGWEPCPDIPRGHYGWVERNSHADEPEAFMDRRDILAYGQAFLDLIDRPNVFDSGKERKTLLYNYAQMCLKAYDFPTMANVAARCTPRQRRLLGDLGHAARPGDFFYAPTDQVEVICGA